MTARAMRAGRNSVSRRVSACGRASHTCEKGTVPARYWGRGKLETPPVPERALGALNHRLRPFALTKLYRAKADAATPATPAAANGRSNALGRSFGFATTVAITQPAAQMANSTASGK